MAELDISREIKQEGTKFIINSDVKEELNEIEYTSVYNQKHAKLNETLDTINSGKDQLSKMEVVEETEELAAFVKMMIKAEEVKKKQKLIKDIQDMEINVDKLRKELAIFTPTMLNIQKQNANKRTEKTEQTKI